MALPLNSSPTEGDSHGETVFRHRLSTRLWHWINAVAVLVMLMSGLMIFNAHPRLYWGRYGANHDPAWLQISGSPAGGSLRVGALTVPTTGVLGKWKDGDGVDQFRAFPGWATLPARYDLAGARRWHLLFAWVLAAGLMVPWAWGWVNGHNRRDLVPRRHELAPRHIWRDIKDHARLRLPTGDAARSYNILQKLAYGSLIFAVLPLMVLTGLTMSPGLNAAWPWLLDLFGGRQSARSIHFLCAAATVAFIVVHLAMVVLAGPWNETRSMVTGWFRLPRPRGGR